MSTWGGAIQVEIWDNGLTLYGAMYGAEIDFGVKKAKGQSEDWPKCLNLLVGAAGFELATPCTPCKCATRLRYAPTSNYYTVLAAVLAQILSISAIFSSSVLIDSGVTSGTGECSSPASSRRWRAPLMVNPWL